MLGVTHISRENKNIIFIFFLNNYFFHSLSLLFLNYIKDDFSILLKMHFLFEVIVTLISFLVCVWLEVANNYRVKMPEIRFFSMVISLLRKKVINDLIIFKSFYTLKVTDVQVSFIFILFDTFLEDLLLV